MRKVSATVAVTAIGVLVAGCGGSSNQSSSSTTTTTSSRPPIAQAALGGLLLTPAEIDTALGITGTKSKEKSDKLDDNSKTQFPNGFKFPDECVFAMGPAETVAYAGSGNTAVSTDDDVAAPPAPGGNTPATNEPDPEVGQAVVLFPSAKEANAFFTASTQRWPACANRQITVPGGPDNPEMNVQSGPVGNANNVLTIAVTVTATDKGTTLMSIGYERALTVRNNVAIDVAVTRKTPPDLAATLAGQIGAKVDKQ